MRIKCDSDDSEEARDMALRNLKTDKWSTVEVRFLF